MVIAGIILLVIGLVVPQLRIFEESLMGHTIKYSLNDASSLCNSILGGLAADSCNIVTLISTILTIVWIAGLCLIIYGVIGKEKLMEMFGQTCKESKGKSGESKKHQENGLGNRDEWEELK